MAIDVKALALLGIDTVWSLIPGELTACTLRDRPASIHDPETGEAAVTWGSSVTLSVFLYDDKKKESETIGRVESIGNTEGKTRSAIVRVSDATGMGELTTKAELLETVTGYQWNVYDVDTPPGNAFHILKLRR